jgi:hypothetical protein
MNRDDVEQQLTSATEQRQQALARLQAAEARAEELAEQQSAIRGEVSIAQRAVAEFTDQIARLEQAVAELRIEEAREAVAAAVRVRDDTAAKAAAAIDAALTLLEQLEEHRRAVADAAKRVRAVTATPGPLPPMEPAVLEEPLQRLEEFVRARSDDALMDDAVTAAATSPLGRAIHDLPVHLQELARRRRERYIQQSRAGARQETPAERPEAVERTYRRALPDEETAFPPESEQSVELAPPDG